MTATNAVAILLLALAPCACARDTMLLESDVPLPRGMSTVRSADIRRSGGTVSGGTFLLAGEVSDARSAVDLAATRFRAAGWTAGASAGDHDSASATFTKDARSASLTLWRRGLDHRMSTGTLTVQTAPK